MLTRPLTDVPTSVKPLMYSSYWMAVRTFGQGVRNVYRKGEGCVLGSEHTSDRYFSKYLNDTLPGLAV